MVLVSLVFLFYLSVTLHLFGGFLLEVVGDLGFDQTGALSMAKIICLEPIKILNIGYILYSLYKSYIINSVGI